MVTSRSELEACGWSVPEDFLDGLSDYERDFIRLEFTGRRTHQYYLDRLRYLDFCGMERVLDAGCGMGQWSVALAAHNALVFGVDLNAGRLALAKRLAAAMGCGNTAFQRARLEALPYPAKTFDGIFCYGVFMFTYMPRTLVEFARILKPGGKLYVNANSFGWYIHLLRDVPWNRRPALGIIKNTLLRRKQAIIVSERWLRARLDEHGFDVVAVDSEGDVSFSEHPSPPQPEPGYQRRYLGVRAIIEAAALRRA